MKRIAAFICPQKISEVKDAFEKLGYPRNTIHYSYLPSNGSRKHKGRAVSWQGSEYLAIPIEKIKLELTVAEKDVDNVRRILIEKARTNGSNGASSNHNDYALIPKSNIRSEKTNNTDGEMAQYANITVRTEPLEVVQVIL